MDCFHYCAACKQPVLEPVFVFKQHFKNSIFSYPNISTNTIYCNALTNSKNTRHHGNFSRKAAYVHFAHLQLSHCCSLTSASWNRWSPVIDSGGGGRKTPSSLHALSSHRVDWRVFLSIAPPYIHSNDLNYSSGLGKDLTPYTPLLGMGHNVISLQIVMAQSQELGILTLQLHVSV